jgi:hypothetical protein
MIESGFLGAERLLVAAVHVQHDVAFAERVIFELVRLDQRRVLVVEPPAPRVEDLDIEAHTERHARLQRITRFGRQSIRDRRAQEIHAVAQLGVRGANLERAGIGFGGGRGNGSRRWDERLRGGRPRDRAAKERHRPSAK